MELINRLRDRKPIQIKPAQALVLGFAALIFLGGLLLTLPAATRSGQSTGFLDALFTATSAVCVTGLVIFDTGTYWSPLGQMIIMILIQIGGLGFMTFGILFAILLGKKIGLKSRLLLQQSFNEFTLQGVVRLAIRVLLITLGIELSAAVLLSLRMVPRLGFFRGVWFSLFHAVSAFNNAGFDIFGSVTGPYSSLTAFYGDPLVLVVLAFLFILGGLGFTVMIDLVRKHRFGKLTLHSKLVVTTTLGLILTGTLAILVLESGNPDTLGEMGAADAVLNAFFQAVTPRTAGFNSLDIAALLPGTQLLIMLLMFIGASPGSTGGGIKTTTFASLFAGAKALVQGSHGAVMYNRKIPEEQISRSMLIMILASSLVITSTFFLMLSDRGDFLTTMFEVISAFGTVGLSMGMTPELTVPGRLIIMLTMFMGRLGPVTVAFALSRSQRTNIIGFPEEKIILG